MLASICACVKLPEPVVTVMLPVVPAVELVNPRTTPALAPLLDFTKLEAETFGDSVPDIEAALISITKLAAAEADASPAAWVEAPPLPNSTNLCVDEFSNPADDDTNTKDVVQALESLAKSKEA